jgi:hypothetical protein
LSHIVNIVRFSIFQYLPNDMRACPFIHVWKYCHHALNNNKKTIAHPTDNGNAQFGPLQQPTNIPAALETK